MASSNRIEIEGIDIGRIALQLNSRGGFTRGTIESYVDDVARSILESKPELVSAVQELYRQIGRGRIVTGDGPTDLFWILSLILMARTIGILGSKSKDQLRDEANRNEHDRFLERYLSNISEVLSQKGQCAELFPYRREAEKGELS